MNKRVILFQPEASKYALAHGIHARSAIWIGEADGFDGVMKEIDARCPSDVNIILVDQFPTAVCADYQTFGFTHDPDNNS